MKIRASLFWAVTAGGLAALLTGESEAVSLRVWLAAFTLWFAVAAFRRFLERAPLTSARLWPLFDAANMRAEASGDTLVRELRLLNGLVHRSATNERSYVQQLRPRLVALADHFLPVNHGIDPRRQPDRVDVLFGNVAWLLDPDVTNRCPTPAELSTFVETLCNDH